MVLKAYLGPSVNSPIVCNLWAEIKTAKYESDESKDTQTVNT